MVLPTLGLGLDTQTPPDDSNALPDDSLAVQISNHVCTSWTNVMMATMVNPNLSFNSFSGSAMEPPLDLQNLCQIFTDDTAIKNSPDLEPDVLPDTILHMAHNRIYIPLSLLTITALNQIQLNHNVKFRKISFGNSAGKTSIDEASFPPEDSLTENNFWQAYKNWLTLVETLVGPAVVEGWWAHHLKMLSDRNFIHWFTAWHAYNKLLWVHFISKPFIIDPRSSIYSEQFEHCRTDLVFLGDLSKGSSGSKPLDSMPNRVASPCF